MTQVHVHDFVPVPFSAAERYASEFFRDRHNLVVHLNKLHTTVTSDFAAVDDTSDPARIHDAVLFVFYPNTRLIPALSAALRMRPEFSGSMLYIDAKYEAPLGLFGKVFDRLVGSRFAHKTMVQFLNDVSADMVQRHETFRNSLPAHHRLARKTYRARSS